MRCKGDTFASLARGALAPNASPTVIATFVWPSKVAEERSP